jgi:hypothetical protein
MARARNAYAASLTDFVPPWAMWPPSMGISAPEIYAGVVPEQEGNQGSNVLDGADPAERDLGDVCGVDLWRRGGGQPGADVAGVDDVDPDALGPEFQASRLGQAAERPLGRGVASREEPVSAAVEPTRTIDPPAVISGESALMPSSAPVTLTWQTRASSSGSSVANRA